VRLKRYPASRQILQFLTINAHGEVNVHAFGGGKGDRVVEETCFLIDDMPEQFNRRQRCRHAQAAALHQNSEPGLAEFLVKLLEQIRWYGCGNSLSGLLKNYTYLFGGKKRRRLGLGRESQP
jgi:hypothetical protein